MTSGYLERRLRTLKEAREEIRAGRSRRGDCPVCGRRPARAEPEICQRCELEAQGSVIDLNEVRGRNSIG